MHRAPRHCPALCTSASSERNTRLINGAIRSQFPQSTKLPSNVDRKYEGESERYLGKIEVEEERFLSFRNLNTDYLLAFVFDAVSIGVLVLGSTLRYLYCHLSRAQILQYATITENLLQHENEMDAISFDGDDFIGLLNQTQKDTVRFCLYSLGVMITLLPLGGVKIIYTYLNYC